MSKISISGWCKYLLGWNGLRSLFFMIFKEQEPNRTGHLQQQHFQQHIFTFAHPPPPKKRGKSKIKPAPKLFLPDVTDCSFASWREKAWQSKVCNVGSGGIWRISIMSIFKLSPEYIRYPWHMLHKISNLLSVYINHNIQQTWMDYIYLHKQYYTAHEASSIHMPHQKS